MFSSFNTKYYDLVAQLKDAKDKIKLFEETLDVINSQNNNTSVIFDFSAVKVISIERNCWKTDRYRTIITYILYEKIMENKYYCSLAEHEDLIQRFKDFKGIK